MLDHLLTVCTVLIAFLSLEIGAQSSDHIHVQTSDIIVVVMDLLILLVVLCLELNDCLVLLGFNLLDLSLTLSLHIFAQTRHLCLVLLLDLVGDALVLLPLLSGQGIVMLVESVTVLGLADFLLLLLNFERAQVLFKFAFINAVLVFGVLELDLSLFLHHGLLIEVLEHQMLQPLPPDLDGDRVFLLQILVLTVFVPELGLLVLELLFGDEPEIVDSETLIVVLSCCNFFLFNVALQSTAFVSHRSSILLIVVIIDGVGALQGLLLSVELLSSCLSLRWLLVGRHDL